LEGGAIRFRQVRFEQLYRMHHPLDAQGADPGMPPLRAIGARTAAALVRRERESQSCQGSLPSPLHIDTDLVSMLREHGHGREILLVGLHAPTVVAARSEERRVGKGW